jgi:rhodanese-related sulfurtransferase
MNAPPSWQRARADQVKALLERDGLLILDIRDEHAFAAGHIAGARYLSNANMEDTLLSSDKSRPVLLYCYHGNASQTCASMFADFGFREVYDLIGGYESWRAAYSGEESLCAA